MVKNRTNKNRVNLNYLHTHRLNWLEVLSVVLSAWFVIYPGPFYQVLAAVLIVIPLLGLALSGLHKPSIASLVTVSISEKYKYDIADFIDLPAFAICFRAIFDYEFEDFYTLIIPGTIALAVTITLLFITHRMVLQKTEKDKRFTVAMVFVCLFAYSYGGTYMTNCAFDTSEAKIYSVKVLDKRYTTTHRKGRKHHYYYLRIAPWGHHYDTEEISVTSAQYNHSYIGGTVEFGLHKGLLGIPWYRLE